MNTLLGANVIEPLVLIISDQTDMHIPLVGRHLEAMSVPYAQFNVADFPLRTQLSLIYEGDKSQLLLQLPNTDLIEYQHVRSIWYRKPHPYLLPLELSLEQRDFAIGECQEAIIGLYKSLDCFWINHPLIIQQAANKSYQLRIAQELGFNVPRTLITNDPSLVKIFYKELHGKIVYKTLRRPFFVENKFGIDPLLVKTFIYTTPLEARHLDFLDSLKFAPGIFQEYISKQIELRVTIVGSQIFAAGIHSQDNPDTIHDWRRYHKGKLLWQPYTLPDSIAALCISLIRKLGLNFGAIDLILSPNEEYIFLEINPNGEYGWIEDQTCLPISEAIAKLLVESGHRR